MPNAHTTRHRFLLLGTAVCGLLTIPPTAASSAPPQTSHKPPRSIHLPPRPPAKRPPAPAQSSSTQHLIADAAAASLPGTVDWSHLWIGPRFFNRQGQPTHPSGSLRITLYSHNGTEISPPQLAPDSPRHGVRRVAVWTRQLSANTGSFLLPLPASVPDHDPRQGLLGHIVITASIPGQPVLQTSITDIPLVQSSWMRDEHLVHRGTRFFPNERTHHGIRRLPRTRQDRTSLTARPIPAAFTH